MKNEVICCLKIETGKWKGHCVCKSFSKVLEKKMLYGHLQMHIHTQKGRRSKYMGNLGILEIPALLVCSPWPQGASQFYSLRFHHSFDSRAIFLLAQIFKALSCLSLDVSVMCS